MTVADNIIISIIIMGSLTLMMRSSSKVSSSGLQFIKDSEALRLRSYKDSGGKWTIGYGHLIKLPEEQYLLDKIISPDKAQQLLIQDIKLAETTIKNDVLVKLTQNQYDALVSLIFNIGGTAFKGSTMLVTLNKADFTRAANEFPKWRFINKKESVGLLARRAKEQSLFLRA